RAPQREAQDGAQVDRVEARLAVAERRREASIRGGPGAPAPGWHLGGASLGIVPQPETRAARPRVGDEVDLTIDRLAHGGAGVGRLEGYVVFVRGAIPGDRVRARVTKSKRSFAEADPVELLEPSPERIEPRAPHPGAPWQVLPYERQLSEKEDQVRDALARIG